MQGAERATTPAGKRQEVLALRCSVHQQVISRGQRTWLPGQMERMSPRFQVHLLQIRHRFLTLGVLVLFWLDFHYHRPWGKMETLVSALMFWDYVRLFLFLLFFKINFYWSMVALVLPHGSAVKNPLAMQETQETQVRSLGQEDSPGGGHGNPLQYSCLEKPMDRGAWRVTDYGVAKSRTWLQRLSSHR